jgi:hypothetical protein
MSQSTSILLVCPACKSRRQVPRELIGQRVRCRQCTAELTVDPPAADDDEFLLADEPKAAPAAVASSPASSAAAAISVDDIPLPALAGPPVELAPVEKRPTEFDAHGDYRVGPVPKESAALKEMLLKPPPVDSAPPDTWVQPPEDKTVAWSFTSGIVTYPFQFNALTQLFMLSVGIAISAWLFEMGFRMLFAGFGAIPGACFCLAGLLIGIAAASYGSACFIAIIENTAYHLDKDGRWPDSDFGEWLYYFLRLIYLVSLAALVALPVAWFIRQTDWTAALIVTAVIVYLSFPVMLLAALESNSPLRPISLPIMLSLGSDWRAWLGFYMASGLLWTAGFFAAIFITLELPFLPLYFTAMLAAVAWFSYARLMGRLASYIMHLDEHEPREKRKSFKGIPDFYPPEYDESP